MAELAKESNRSVADIKNDVKTLAEEYQKNGDSIPLSYKKAYEKMGVYSEAAEKKMSKSSDDAKKKIDDDAEEMGDSHKKNSSEAANGWKTAFSVMGKLSSSGAKVVASGLKVFAAGVTAAATGVATLGTAAIKSYADYEQLVGGIETLFGAGGAASVQEYAKNVGKSVSEVQDEFNMLMEAQTLALSNADAAYANAGMSANDYMETVTSFAASLKASTENEVDAAEAANNAVIDMADNANKMGTNMESIQDAYQGFAKQNYTMLDNLKLGYGGTKEEMQRLLEDAEKLTGIKYDINNLSDMYSAIHVIQTELGITGTTAKEAGTTISGSMNMAKAAWSNLLTGIADDNADFDALVNNFVESAAVAAENLMPRIEVALGGIGQLIESLLPVIVSKIPDIINNAIPDLLQSGINMISTLLDGIQQSLPQISQGAMQIVMMMLSAFIQMLPQLLAIGVQIITTIANGIQQNLPQIVQGAMQIIMQLITTLVQMLPQILEMGLQVIVQLAEGIAQSLPDLIPTIIDIVLQIVETLLDNIDMIIDAAIELIIGLAEGLITAIPILVEKVPVIIVKLVNALVTNAPKLLEASFRLIQTIADGLITNVPKLIKKVPEIIQKLKEEFIDGVHRLIDIAKNIISVIADGLIDNIYRLTGKTPTILLQLKNSFMESLDQFANIGETIITNIWNGISAGWDWLTGKVSELANHLFKTATDALSGASSGSGSNTSTGVSNTTKKATGYYNPVQSNNGATAETSTLKASSYVVSSGYAAQNTSGINYEKFGNAVATAMAHAGLRVEVDERTLGRIVREAYT